MMVGMRNFHKEKEVIPDSNFGCPKGQTSLPRKTQQTRYIILKK